MAAQVAIAPGSAVTANNIDFGVWLSNRGGEIAQEVEQPWIDMMDVSGAMVTQEMFKLVNGLWHIGVADAIYHINALVGVRMKEPQPVDLRDIRRRTANSGIPGYGNEECQQNGNQAAQENHILTPRRIPGVKRIPYNNSSSRNREPKSTMHFRSAKNSGIQSFCDIAPT